MNAVYDLSDGRRLMLYTENNRIMVLITPFYRGSVPLTRHRDCLGRLFSAVYHEKIYYVYENFAHQIVFSCLEDQDTTIVLTPSESEAVFERPLLKVLSGKLYLFYQVQISSDQWQLKMTDPRAAEDQNILYRFSGGPGECRWYVHENRQFLSLYGKNICQASFVWDEEKFQYTLWKDEGDLCYEHLEAKQAVLMEENRRLKQECDDLEKKLQSAKNQYDQLVQTAEKLQKAGRLWRDKYLSIKG